MMEIKDFEKKDELSEVHKVLLEMMKTLAVVFEKHQLRYALYCGTLLGAIRHKGFIPWDDDVDIVMPLKDYRKFCRFASKDLPDGFFILTPEKNARYNSCWTKVYREGTTMLFKSQLAYDITRNLFVDIYPMIGGSSNSWLRSLQPILIKVAKVLLSLDQARAIGYFGKRYIRAKKGLSYIPYPIRWLVARGCLRLAELPPEKSSRIGSIDAADFCAKYERAWWKEMTTATFEDTEFVIPVEYDKILKVIYGDYMKLPPEEKRFSHGSEKGDIIYDMHRDYKEYREELLGLKKQRKDTV